MTVTGNQKRMPNQPGPVNGGGPLLLQAQSPWPAVTDPERSMK
jgi:hypothetical protein